MSKKLRNLARSSAVALGALLVATVFATVASFHLPPSQPEKIAGGFRREIVLDRQGRPLSSTFENDWNYFEKERLDEIPELLREAFVVSEDRKFWSHHGVDWRSRMAALYQLISNRRIVRGASTLTEQVARLLTPRSRSPWARWMETWEAYAIEARWDKASILEFYLNQVPYAARRRGVAQAARLYFGRDLDTLNTAELLALAVAVRAPSILDPRKNPSAVAKRVLGLAQSLGLNPNREESLRDLRVKGFEINDQSLVGVEAPHFTRFVRSRALKLASLRSLSGNNTSQQRLESTLDGEIQNFAQELLDEQLRKLKASQVHHGALLVVDHQNGDVLAWAVGGQTQWDTVRVPRQPGSSLKPFLYGLALEKGWTPATVIIDEPIMTAIGRGLHPIRNYSRTNYGPVTLRQALGNSLNVPAIKTVKYVTPLRFLDFLRGVGFSTLHESAGFYGEGLALGSAEVPLFELVQAYTLFANGGHVRPLRVLKEEKISLEPQEQLSPEVASIITDILSDPKARLYEFGRNSILNFPIPTAIKTGTATDYRDAWAVGFNSRYLVGVWMGDLDRLPSNGNTGARGPALVLRAVMSALALRDPDHLGLLPRSQNLISQEVCFEKGTVSLADGKCASYPEIFVPGTENTIGERPTPIASERLRFVQPVSHLEIAWDPRIPADSQALEFRLEGLPDAPERKIEWILDGKQIAQTREGSYLWPLSRGKHRLQARVSVEDSQNRERHSRETEIVSFSVK